MTTARIRQVAAAASSAEVRTPSAQNRACAPSPIGPSPGGPPALSGESARKTGLYGTRAREPCSQAGRVHQGSIQSRPAQIGADSSQKMPKA